MSELANQSSETRWYSIFRTCCLAWRLTDGACRLAAYHRLLAYT